jgi:hypothetical protein
MNIKKRIHKVRNYWFFDSFFRERMYCCLSEIFQKEEILLDGNLYDEIFINYRDSQISPAEISAFFSGFFFDTSSNFLMDEFNSLGRELGYKQILVFLMKTIRSESETELLSLIERKFPDIYKKIPSFSNVKVDFFIHGFKNEEYSWFDDIQKSFWLAGNDIAKENIFSILKKIRVFDLCS